MYKKILNLLKDGKIGEMMFSNYFLMEMRKEHIKMYGLGRKVIICTAIMKETE